MKEFVTIFDIDENGNATSVESSLDDADDLSPREKHLRWCKRRAIELLDAGDPGGAFTSMISDLGKSTETINHPSIVMGGMLLASGNLDSDHAMRNFILGFH